MKKDWRHRLLIKKQNDGNLLSILRLSPEDAVELADFTSGFSTWNLDAVNMTNLGQGRTISKDGDGVFVGVLVPVYIRSGGGFILLFYYRYTVFPAAGC